MMTEVAGAGCGARDQYVWKLYADKLNSAVSKIRAPFHSDLSQHLKVLKGDIDMQRLGVKTVLGGKVKR